MTRRQARAALAVALVGLAGCGDGSLWPLTRTELLPRFDLGAAADFQSVDLVPPAPAPCPIDIDVFGPADTLFPDCGGPQHAAYPAGYFAPGTADYDASLAGQLQAALSARFGVTFHVRACGSQQQFLSSLTSVTEAPTCSGSEIPPGIGQFASACTSQPGSLAVLVAAEPLDRCHGGSFPGQRDMSGAYATEFAARIDAFLEARKPTWVMIGGQTEWTPQPSWSYPYSCNWTRGDWSGLGVRRWRELHPTPPPSIFFDNDDLHSDFKDHSACCVFFKQGKGCKLPTWVASDPGSPIISCDGAQQIAAHWIDRVRDLLARPQFTCAN